MRVVVVGAGVAGLAAATLLARGGASVQLVERASAAGGRARSQEHAGAVLNLGPHALYTHSVGAPVLAELGVTLAGGTPPSTGCVLRGGALHALPGGPGSFVSSTALSAGEKLHLVPYLSPLGQAPDTTVEAWLGGSPAGTADLVRGLVRVSSYCNAPEQQSARAAQRQLRAALRGVRYLDGGWGAMVAALEGALPSTVERVHDDVAALPDADAVVLATNPAHARSLGVPLPTLTPVRAACLDLVLRALPRPTARFVLGLDDAVYLSEHGSIAKLGGTVVHVARYLAPGESGAQARAGLEALMDLAQPGWRDAVLFERFLPELIVTHRVDRVGKVVAAAHRVEGRRVVLAGDWVGEQGMLVDRALASAAAAARALLAGAE